MQTLPTIPLNQEDTSRDSMIHFDAGLVSGRRTSLYGAQPRRPRRPARAPVFDIHEDISTTTTPLFTTALDSAVTASTNDDLQPDANCRSSLLTVPPQCLGLATIHANAANTTKRRISHANENAPSPFSTIQNARFGISASPARASRRRTIYVPPEDTTILTIHPGAQHGRSNMRPKPSRKSDLFLDLATLTESSLLQEQSPARVSSPRKKAIMVPPRRAPLRHVTRQLQAAAFDVDIPGSGSGKENIPPGMHVNESCKKNQTQFSSGGPGREKNIQPRQSLFNLSQGQRSVPRPVVCIPPEAASPPRVVSSTLALAQPREPRTNRSTSHPLDATVTPKRTSFQRSKFTNALTPSRIPIPSPRTPSKLSVPVLGTQQPSGTYVYPLITEHITNANLYEDDWLSHQEVALAGLINDLFDKSGCSDSHASATEPSLRTNLLDLYDNQSVAALQVRLQASLRFGALSISNETLSRVSRVKDDIGLSRKFLDLWMKTYHLEFLKAAAEVVVGREAVDSVRLLSSPRNTTLNSHRRSKTLELFLLRCLLRNEDNPAKEHGSPTTRTSATAPNDSGSTAWAWRRTVTRSLMLILLIDQAASSGIFRGCVFQTSSSHKSSESVLSALIGLLVPSVGVPVRLLSRLNCTVAHVQYPLQEYSYHINNLAVDLRDGIILTRLVELLLYPSTSTSQIDTQENATISFTLPSSVFSPGTSRGGKQVSEWPLSQHLKYPCTSRVQKLFNAQIALAALRGTKSIGTMLDHIGPHDIVDGHRERTVGLLWSIASRWGLGLLIDFNALQTEIRRLKKAWRVVASCQRKNTTTMSKHVLEDDVDEKTQKQWNSDLDPNTALLLSWTAAAARLHGVNVHNLSTSFADGGVYQAIMDEYGQCVAHDTKGLTASYEGPTMSTENNLHGTLQAFGCSDAFIALFPTATSTTTSVPGSIMPSKQTTISLLAFLASRFLPAAQPYLAAIKLQRWWRTLKSEAAAREMWGLPGSKQSGDVVSFSARNVKALLARECQEVVMMRACIVRAAVVLQRCWMEYVRRRGTSRRLAKD